MICHYCRTENSDDDHRCQRCGRRLQAAQPMGVSSSYNTPYSRTAVAHALAPETQTEPEPIPEQIQEAPAPSTLQYQRQLFSNREGPQVIQLERSGVATRPVRPASEKQKTTRVRQAQPVPGQQRLDFPASAAPVRTAGPAPGSLIDCDALTATVSSRVTAFAFDATMILASAAIFLAVVRFGAKGVSMDRTSLIVMGISVVLIAAFYKLLWCLGNGNSPGMQWAKLRLINFNGRRPTRRQRLQRAVSGVLSFAAVGLGLVWALVDEEALTWHDHISKCFPTMD